MPTTLCDQPKCGGQNKQTAQVRRGENGFHTRVVQTGRSSSTTTTIPCWSMRPPARRRATTAAMEMAVVREGLPEDLRDQGVWEGKRGRERCLMRGGGREGRPCSHSSRWLRPQPREGGQPLWVAVGRSVQRGQSPRKKCYMTTSAANADEINQRAAPHPRQVPSGGGAHRKILSKATGSERHSIFSSLFLMNFVGETEHDHGQGAGY